MRYLLLLILFLSATNAFGQETRPDVRAGIWKKDPFLPPQLHAEILDEEVPPLLLSAVLYSEGHSLAIINGKGVHEGDEIEGFKIVEIKRTHVILKNKKKSFSLEIKK